MLTLAEETRVLDWDLRWADALPAVDRAGLLEARRQPDAARIVTVGRDFILREWWADFAPVVEEARRILAP